MKNTSNVLLILALLVSIFAISSCTLVDNPNTLPTLQVLPGSEELQNFQTTFMASFEMFNGSFSSSSRALTPFQQRASSSQQARATVPLFGADSITLPTGSTELTGSRSDYPEPAQNSNWTISGFPPVPNAYEIKVTTSFQSYDPRSFQEEIYLIKDVDTNGQWTTADLIIDSTGVQNDAYRLYNRLYYRDGSFQDEVIVQVRKPTTAGNMLTGYDYFGVFDASDALDYPDVFAPTLHGGVGGATYSSVVAYTRSFLSAPSYSFWAGKRARSIVGVRYYTEHLTEGDTKLVSDLAMFEKAIDSLVTTSGSFVNASSDLFLPALASNRNPTLLSQSVLRQQITYGWNSASSTVNYNSASRDTRMKTVVVNISNNADYYITRVNNEAALLVNGSSTINIPSGDATEIVNSDPDAAVFNKFDQKTVTTGSLTPLDIVVGTATGDLGTLYKSLAEGAASIAINGADDIPGDITGTVDVKSFSGAQGFDTGANASYTAAGTVEAWVYMNSVTDTGGIVHAGKNSDWLDELWSLQLNGTSRQVMFALVAQGPYTYGYALSGTKINTKKWYYLVGTWSSNATNTTLKVYINGVLDKTSTSANVKTSSSYSGPVDVIVGSQFYADKVLPGYYGFDGKINGVLFSAAAKTPTEILDFYNLHKAKTANW